MSEDVRHEPASTLGMHSGYGQPVPGIEYPADGTWSPEIGGELDLNVCNGSLHVESYLGDHPGLRFVRLTDRLTGKILSLRWEQWEDLVEAIRA